MSHLSTSKAPTLVVVELDGSGHRLWYVRLIIEAARELLPRECIHVMTTPQVLARAEWAVHLADVVDDEQVRTVAPTPNDRLHEVLARAAVDGAFVVVPDGDHFLKTANKWPADLGGSLLVVRAHPQPGLGGRVRHAAKLRAIDAARRRSPGLQIVSLEMTERSQHPAMVRRSVAAGMDPVRFAPLAVSADEWLEQNGIPTDRPVALVIGDLSERKYLPEILQAWAASDRRAALVLVGSPTTAVREQAESMVAGGGLFLRFGFCSDEDFDTWIASADTIFAMHRNPGASGVTLKGWVSGAPLVVNDEPLSAMVCEELSVDALLVDGSVSSLRHAFEVIAGRPRGVRSPQAPVRAGHEVPLALLDGLLETSVRSGGSS